MNIVISRYDIPTDAERAALEGVHFSSDTWESVVEPEDRSWILYVGKDGTPVFWPQRDAAGGVIGEPVTR